MSGSMSEIRRAGDKPVASINLQALKVVAGVAV